VCGWFGGAGSGGGSWNSKEAGRKFQALLMVITSAHTQGKKAE